MAEQVHILVVDDDKRMARTLVDILQVKGYQAEAVHSGSEAMAMLQEGHFQCVLTDIRMPGLNGVALYRQIKSAHPDLPVVLMTAYASDEHVREALAEGAIAAIAKPLDINSLLCFCSALRRLPSVVIVDDDPEFCRTLGAILTERGFTVTQVTDPGEKPETICRGDEILVLDMRLRQTSGLEVLKALRKKHPHLPVILVTGYREEMAGAVEAGMKINAFTCLYKPLQIDELLALLGRIQRQELGRILGRAADKTT